MRGSLIVAVSLVIGWSAMASAQTPGGQTVSRTGGIVGTAVGAGAGARQPGGGEEFREAARGTNVRLGTGHVGAGTNGLGQGLGNAVGGIRDTASGAGSGGMGDVFDWGSSLGGVNGVGRGQGVGSGGIGNRYSYGIDTGATGGISANAIGAGTGGLRDQNSLGSGTGGTQENNAPRFRIRQ